MMKKVVHKIKEYKKNNARGFTLIEMLGVIVIMGLILIVVFPTMTKMIRGNDDEKFNSYYDLVEEAAYAYATTQTDKLGTSRNVGCTKVTLNTLIDSGYVQKFDGDEECKTGANGIVIRNNEGSLSVSFNLTCGERTGGKNDANECSPYKIKEVVTLKTKIDTSISASEKASDGTTVYITGGNNYVWYSGKMWRIVSYSNSTEVIKMVTVNPITSIYYNSTKSSSYTGSDVETWLNNDFLASLKDQQSFLINSSWKINDKTSIKSRIGLITSSEFDKVKLWYYSDGNTKTWLLTEGTNQKSYYSGTTVESDATDKIYGVRPAVTLSPDVVYISGDGSEGNPYIIDNSPNAFGQKNDLLNTRYSGEYVSLNGYIYRIVSTDGTKTKVIGTNTLENNKKYRFSDNYWDYSSSEMRDNVEKLSPFSSSLITTGEFCLDTINNANLTYRSARCLTPERVNNSIKIGLPKIGDFFTTKLPNVVENYWTINPNVSNVGDAGGSQYNSTINVIKSDGGVEANIISSSNAVVPVFYLNENTKIISGNGMPNSPYVLG